MNLKQCFRSEKGKETKKQYSQYEKYKEAIKKAQKRYFQTENGIKAKRESDKRYRESDKCKERMKRYNQSYEQSEKCKEYRKRYSQTIQRRIARNLRIRVCRVLKGISKSASTLKLLDCTIKEFLAHLESLFQEGMTFKNYGLWEIDHIIPCSAFDLVDPDQQRKCFNYKNLQPLWREDNMSKSSKILL